MREGYVDSMLGEIPKDWDIVEVQKVSKVIDSLHITPVFSDEGYPMVRVGDINKDRLNLNNCLKVSKEVLNEFNRNHIPMHGDILMTRVGSFGKTILVDTNERFCIGQNTVVITEIDNSQFLYHVFNSSTILKQFNLLTNGSSQPSLSLKDIRFLKVIKPPLPEQQKIAEILSTVDDKIDVIDQQISETQTLKKGLMQRLLTKGIGHTKFKDSPLGEIPESWKIIKLGNCVKLTSGTSPSKFNFESTGQVMFYKVNQLNDCSKFMGNSPYRFNVNPTGNNISQGSIIFPKRGASIFTNKVRILQEDAFVDTNIMALTTKGNIEIDYLYYFILDYELGKIADTSSVPQINNKHIEPLKLPLPSLPEQQKIASILSTVDEKLEVLQDKKQEYQELKKGLMQQLLTGKTRVAV